MAKSEKKIATSFILARHPRLEPDEISLIAHHLDLDRSARSG